MNDAQQIFAVFYAIFWGATFNVLPRWKPFNYGLIFNREVRHVTRRIGLALVIFNILPIIYFVIIFLLLNNTKIQRNCWFDISKLVLSGIIPSFGIFGFNRLWLGIIEKYSQFFYVTSSLIPWKYKAYYGAVQEPESGLEKLGICPSSQDTWLRNIIVGLTYIILAGSGVIIPYPVFIILILISAFCFLCYWSRFQTKYFIIVFLSIIIFLLMISFIFHFKLQP